MNKSANKKSVNLALQGGGAHGAFTWGILDRFLELDLFNIEGISATSAGSMNAIVLAQGMLAGGNEGARKLLYEFWHKMSDIGKWVGITTPTPMDVFFQPLLHVPMNFQLFTSLTNLFSPYEFNPFNFHPIREILQSMIDMEQIKSQGTIKLFICATNVQSGKIRIFKRDELTVDMILASACLPKLFQAVPVDNQHYWDGGYLGNPAIFPLIYNTEVRDIIVLHVVPVQRDIVPQTVVEIDARLREISFNSSLIREMRAIAFVTKLIDQGWMKPEYADRLKRIYMHCVRADKALEKFPLASVYVPDWEFLLQLYHLGRITADNWLEKNYNAIGEKTTVDFNEWM